VDWGDLILKVGVGGGAIVVVLKMFWKVLNHLMDQSNKLTGTIEKMVDQNKEQNESFLKENAALNAAWQKAIDEHTSQARNFHESTNKAFEYIRQEHRESLENQIELCKISREIVLALAAFKESCVIGRSSCKEKLETIQRGVDGAR